MLLITENTNTEEENFLYQGSRELTVNEIDKLVIILTPVFDSPIKEDTKEKAARLLAEQCLREELNFETSLNLWGNLSLNIETLKEIYSKKAPEEILRLHEILAEELGRKQAAKINNEVIKIVHKPRHYGMITGDMGSDNLVLIDPINKKVLYEVVNTRNDRDYSRQTIVIDAYPTEVVVYDSPLPDEPRKFEAIWHSDASVRPRKIGPDLVEDIRTTLSMSGFVSASRLIVDVLPAVFNTYIKKGYAKIKTDIETPGFFHNPVENKIVAVKYDLNEPPIEELEQALKVLDELAEWYRGHEDKLATVFKWGLMAPFIYSRKQLGNWVPWPYLYGKARSGKTTLGQMVLYMWGEPGENNDLTGGGFDTVARVGNRISQSTFPIVINEPAGAFKKISVSEMIKGAIERITGRGRYEGRQYRNIPSYAPVIFTANQFVPEDDALIRRLLVMNFTHSEKKTDEEIANFERLWQTKNHKKCRFNLFKSIAQFVAVEITNDVDLMEMDWQELINSLLVRLYSDVGREPPGWIYNWCKSESMEDLDEDHREEIRNFLLDKINYAYGRVTVIDPETGKALDDNYTTKIKKTSAFKERVWTVLNERLIPWMVPVDENGKNYVVFTLGFKKEVHHALRICQPLKGISELLGWEYKNKKMPKQQKVILIRLDKFLDFLFPTEADNTGYLEVSDREK
jgi:hypothetical protein